MLLKTCSLLTMSRWKDCKTDAVFLSDSTRNEFQDYFSFVVQLQNLANQEIGEALSLTIF